MRRLVYDPLVKEDVFFWWGGGEGGWCGGKEGVVRRFKIQMQVLMFGRCGSYRLLKFAWLIVEQTISGNILRKEVHERKVHS